MAEVGIVEARRRFSHLLHQAERGEAITITRRGRPVARLIAIDGRKDRRRTTIAELKELRRGQTLGGLSVRELVDDGRR